MNATAEHLWSVARDLRGEGRDRRRPSVGIIAVLVTLEHHGPVHGSEVARLARQDQGNVSRWLLKLHEFGFADGFEEVPGLGHQGGGRPARMWRLTAEGRELIAALRAEPNEGVAS